MTDFDAPRFRAALQKAFSENALSRYLSFERVALFEKLTLRMLGENEKYNLTAIKEPEKIALLHYADCVSCAGLFPTGARIADIGCGAGFPTLPLAIVRPDLKIVAVDSTEKRVAYVRDTAEELGLSSVTTAVFRAEDAGRDPAWRETFDYVTARAVAPMRILAELCIPLVRVGGEMIAMKGKNAGNEAQEAKRAIAVLGGKLLSVDETPLVSSAFGEMSHAVIRVKKERKTQDAYPRAYAQISKKPL